MTIPFSQSLAASLRRLRGSGRGRRPLRRFRTVSGWDALEARTLLSPTIIDNDNDTADPSFDAPGWSYINVTGARDNDISARGGNNGSAASWNFDVPAGNYSVAVTWALHPFAFFRSNSATYTVLDGTASVGSASLDQTQTPEQLGGFLSDGTYWVGLGAFHVTGGDGLVVQLTDAAPAGKLNVADAVRIVRTDNPEIAVADQDGTPLTDGVSSVDFGTTTAGTPLTRAFTITNSGPDDLILGPNVSFSDPAFSVVGAGFSRTIVPTGQSATLTVQLDAAPGTYAGTLSFQNNDADEDPFDIAIRGVVDQAPIEGPEVQVYFNGVSIADGGLANFGTVPAGTSVVRDFTVRNIGTEPVLLGTLTVNPGGFSLESGFGDTELSPNESTTFQVRINTVTAGFRNGSLEFRSNDPNEDPYNITLSGLVSESVGPDIKVLVDAVTDLTNQTGSVNFGATTIASPLVKVFQVQNVGDQPLTLGSISLPTGFGLFSSPGAGTLSPGASTTFSVIVDTSQAAVLRGQAMIASNDPDENPFTFGVSAVVATRPGPDLQLKLGETVIPDDTGAVDFGNTLAGRPIEKEFTVTNVGTQLLSLGGVSLPAGFSLVAGPGVSSLAPGDSTTFTARLDAAVQGDFSGQLQIATNDADDALFNVLFTGMVTLSRQADATVLVNGNTVADDTGVVDFGTRAVGSPVDLTFTIRNDGNYLLLLPSAITLPDGFSLVSDIGLRILKPGQSTTFTVRLRADAPGTFDGMLSFRTNDPNSPSYDFRIRGSVTGS